MTQPSSPRLVLGSFTIVQPSHDQAVTLGAGNTVHVEVDFDGTFDGFCAAVYDSCGPTPSFAQCKSLMINGNTATGDLPVNFLDAFDIPDVDKRVVVYAQSSGDTGRKIQQFRVLHGSPGPVLGVGVASASGSQGRCGFCSGDNPIPVSLQLTPNVGDGGIASGDCDNCDALNSGAILHHSGDACFSCCWYSDAIDFCEDDEEPGYWKLQKTDVATWDLWLLQPQDGDDPITIIHYTVATQTDNDCSFPIALGLDANSVGTECTGWPDSITISQGP